MSLAMWQARAIERAAILKIEQSKLLDSAQLVISALGADWLKKQETLTKNPQRGISNVHPLYRDLNSSSDSAIIMVCELAQYLRNFMSDPAIRTILADLRSDKYESTLFELAKATRWMTAGATVTLQPIVPGGAADFDAVIDGMEVVVEASTFPADDFSQRKFKIGGIVERAIKSVVNDRFPVAVKVRLTSFTEGDFDGALGKAIRDACHSLISELAQGGTAVVLKTLPFGTVSAELITPDTEDVTESDGSPTIAKADWDLCGRICLRRKQPGEYAYMSLKNPDQFELFRSFIKLPEVEDDPNRKIIKKLEKEARQLRGVEQPRVVILEVSALAKEGLLVSDDGLREEILHAMRNISLVGVWLFSSVFTAQKRHLFMGRYISNPKSEYQLPETFKTRLERQEGHWDFINRCAM
jgi:hypothetical protein